MSARKKNSLSRQVRRAYRQDTLARICTLPENKFASAFGMQTVKVAQHRPHNYYHFRDNGANVLAVAHLDTVVRKERRTPRFETTKAGPLITSGALDDRLGAYTILSLLPGLGITCDWLLTVGEESGQSTANLFEPGKDYDWVIEFDRMGTDVVMYQYEDETSCQAVQASGAAVGEGIFSDICYLEHLGVKAFNWGVGYRGNYHSEHGYAYLNDTFAMVARYLRFHEQNAGITMPHQPGQHSYGTGIYGGTLECWICSARAVDHDTDICAECGSCQSCYLTAASCQCHGGTRECGVCSALAADHDTDICAECGSCQSCYMTAASCQCYTGHWLAASQPVSQMPALAPLRTIGA